MEKDEDSDEKESRKRTEEKEKLGKDDAGKEVSVLVVESLDILWEIIVLREERKKKERKEKIEVRKFDAKITILKTDMA